MKEYYGTKLRKKDEQLKNVCRVLKENVIMLKTEAREFNRLSVIIEEKESDFSMTKLKINKREMDSNKLT